ncbi:MAG: cell division protein SepF [Lachnospiraceae bacterium]|nr:cell division protein SepF [Lachnospiraceae bacterium]
MKKLSGRFLDMMKLSDDDDFEDMIEEDFEEEEEEEKPKSRFSFFGKKKEAAEEYEEDEPAPAPQKTTKVNQPVPERKQKTTSRKNPNIVSIGRGEEVKVVKPQSFNESKTITDYLRANKTVVVNLEGIEITTAQRIIDCIGGASYALGGSLEPISNKIFIVAPRDVEISGDLIDQIAGDSFISPDLGSF